MTRKRPGALHITRLKYQIISSDFSVNNFEMVVYRRQLSKEQNAAHKYLKITAHL